MDDDLATDLRHATRIGSVEVRRSVRAILASRRQLAGLVLMLVALLPAGFAFVTGSYAAGLRYGDGTDFPVVVAARAQVTASLGSMTVLFGLRMVERASDVDHADLMLTTVRPRAVVTGLILAEFARVFAVFGIPIALCVAAFAVGAGTPLMVPVVLAGLVPILAAALAGGFVLAYLARLLYRRCGWGNLFRAGVGLAVMVGLVLWITVFLPEDPGRILAVIAPLSAAPVGPYADLLLVASPFAVSLGVESVTAVLLVFSLSPLLLSVAWRLAPRLWYGDRVQSGTTAEESETARLDGRGVPGVLARRRTTRLVWWQWLRGLRAPAQFVHLFYFLFMTFPIAQYAVQHPRSPVVPLFVAVLGAFLAGGTFGLNPLGMEGSMLPTIATTPSPGRPVVHARLLAGVLLWLPLTILLVVVTGLFSTLDVVSVSFVVTITLGLVWLSCTLGLALGCASPRFERVRAFGGVEAPTPTTVALLGHSFLTILFAALGFAFVFGPAVYDRPPFVGRTELFAQVGGLAFWGLAVVLIGAICYRYAIRRVNTFTYG